MYGYIYKTTNLINNKIYIGQHKSKKFDTSYIGSGIRLHEAINKYGKSAFKCEMIEECIDLATLNAREIYWISYYNATDKEVGYNIKYGGNSQALPDEVKRKISKSSLGKKKSAKARENMSKAKKGKPNINYSQKGKIWITNDIESHLVDKNLLEMYVSAGYRLGRAAKTTQQLMKYKAIYANRVYVNNGINQKYIPVSELDTYLAEGWKKGVIKYSESRCKNISAGKRGTIKIVKDSKIKYIDPLDFDIYSKQGYIKITK